MKKDHLKNIKSLLKFKTFTDENILNLCDVLRTDLNNEWESLLPLAVDVRNLDKDETGDYFYKTIDGTPVHDVPTARVWYLRIYDKHDQMDGIISNRFNRSILELECVPGIRRVFIVFIAPNADLPRHIDDLERPPYDPSETYNLVLGVSVPSEDINDLGINIHTTDLNLKNNHAILFDANVPHNAWNKTNDWWISSILVVDKTYWNKE